MEFLEPLLRMPWRPASVPGSANPWNGVLIHGVFVRTEPIERSFKGIVNGSLLFSRNSPDPHRAAILHHCGTMVTWTISSTKCCWAVRAVFFFFCCSCCGSANALHYCIAAAVPAAEWLSAMVAHSCVSLALSRLSKARAHTHSTVTGCTERPGCTACLSSVCQPNLVRPFIPSPPSTSI